MTEQLTTDQQADAPASDEQVGDPKTADVEEPEASVPEPEPEPGPEPELEPAANIGMDERAFEQAAQKLDRAVESYKAKVTEFIEATGQALILNETDLAFVPGYVFHPQVKPLDDDQAAFARILLGEPIEPPFPPDPMTHACTLCDGWGRVKTGSKVPGQGLVNCPNCNAKGFTTRRSAGELVSAAPPVGPDEPVAVLTEEEQAGEDAWGTPRSHPDWGKSPQYRSPNWQGELEAYKAGQPAPLA